MQEHTEASGIISINVGGTLFSTRLSTLRILPNKRLGRLTTSAEEYSKEKEYFFYDRNPHLFQYILDLYRHGTLHVPSNVCGATLKSEMNYWEIPLEKLSVCSLATLCKHEEAVQSMEQLVISFAANQDETIVAQRASGRTLFTIRRMVWLFLTSRNSSRGAKVFSILYYLMASLSVLIFVLGTHGAFREPRAYQDYPVQGAQFLQQPGVLAGLDNAVNDTVNHKSKQVNPKIMMFILTQRKAPLVTLDEICLVFFAVELFLRLLSCPSFSVFFKNVLGLLDSLIVMCLLIAFGFELWPTVMHSSRGLFWFYVVCKAMVILRIIRLFRVTQDVGGLKVLMLAVRSTFRQLLSLGAFVLITVVFFSSVMYYIEFENDNSSFSNIPITIWWSIITVTTVGYGDITPSTYLGYTIASLFAVCGILLVAMPIAIVAEKFAELSFLNIVRERKEKSEREVNPDATRKTPKVVINKVYAKSSE